MWQVFKAAALIAAMALAACGDQRAPEAPAPANSETFLIEAAANDFRLHVAPNSAEFRNTHIGIMRGESGADRNILCGEFRHADQQEWQAFATIQTEPYENWLGGVATAHCTNPNTTLETGRDVSDLLTQHYRARD